VSCLGKSVPSVAGQSQIGAPFIFWACFRHEGWEQISYFNRLPDDTSRKVVIIILLRFLLPSFLMYRLSPRTCSRHGQAPGQIGGFKSLKILGNVMASVNITNGPYGTSQSGDGSAHCITKSCQFVVAQAASNAQLKSPSP